MGWGSKPWLRLVKLNRFRKIVLNFDFRNGAKKSGRLDHPLQSYGQIYFNIFQYILQKVDFELDQKQKYFH